MPGGTHTEELNISPGDIWNFIKDMNNWAPLVPGYIDHNIRNEKQSTWKFKGDLGIIQKKIHLRVDITKWEEPTRVVFHLTGLNEKFNGHGYFKAETTSNTKTNITGYLDITAKGLKGPLINGVLKSFVPKTTQELTTNIANKLKELNSEEK